MEKEKSHDTTDEIWETVYGFTSITYRMRIEKSEEKTRSETRSEEKKLKKLYAHQKQN